MYYVPIKYKDIQLNDKVACICKQYGNVQTGTVTYIGKYGLTVTDSTGHRGILFHEFDFNKELI